MSEKAQRRAAERYEVNEESIVAKAVTYMMNSYECRMFLYMLLDEFGTEGTPFSSAGDSHTNFNAGMQNAGLILRNHIVSETPEAYLRMLTERKALDERTERNDAERRSRANDSGLRPDDDALPIDE